MLKHKSLNHHVNCDTNSAADGQQQGITTSTDIEETGGQVHHIKLNSNKNVNKNSRYSVVF